MSVSATSPAVADPALSEFLNRSGLVKPGEGVQLVPLTGGVASDIFRVEVGERTFVVKKALARLRVAQEWNAPVSRNASEVGWFIEAQRAVPQAVPDILAHDPALGLFAMTYLDPAHHSIWKNELRDGRVSAGFAAAVGQAVVAIHEATARSAEVARRFSNDETFHAIRLEPYLEATARRHGDLAEELCALSRDTLRRKLALVHGDVSPKNILAGPAGPVLLDAECAWYGEPAFDLAFCLNHLLLKCVWKRQHAAQYLASFDALAAAYISGVGWEPPEAVEARAARLLPALFLGRIDGKSPAEYITTEADRERVRRVARHLIASRPKRLSHIRDQWAKEILP
ncbi:phosphotransferase [Methylobacterium longum]|uniref:Phosphotransferase n=1 Tax=Methylobacterium longum TaxID=767694 RepID=A0ABT8AUK6_9HYPH|nr:phosphotransferase [Methylobacterium longum]MDN3573095.1 phosphotransferase [Methylobacterium longum]GJE12096.1 Methylthioribose kinase [Methylobacterium longum]